ncbi:cupin domain-containing protein [Halomonas sp. BC04]|uniref:cupin domain-containing protein n=1 Tax=Halomonas sp. BC04 TaxID=1403540 RepID=UPI0003ED686B|nr:cupin domain-containing protein [Halomonas sp. BC04]EWG98759.1 cupin [Halomonas sp. BC04]
MHKAPIVLCPEDKPTSVSVLGTDIEFLVTDDAANGYHITLQSGAEGSGPPPHSHGWDEAFFILTGQVFLTCRDRTYCCQPGTFVNVPAGEVHAFTYGEGGGRMLEITGNGSRAGQLFRELNRDIAPGAPNLDKVAEVFTRNGVTLNL